MSLLTCPPARKLRHQVSQECTSQASSALVCTPAQAGLISAPQSSDPPQSSPWDSSVTLPCPPAQAGLSASQQPSVWPSKSTRTPATSSQHCMWYRLLSKLSGLTIMNKKGTRTLKPCISWFEPAYSSRLYAHDIIYLKNVVRPSCDYRATCENSHEAARGEKNSEGGHNAGNQSGSVKAWLQQAGSRCANARMPWGDTTAHRMVERCQVRLS